MGKTATDAAADAFVAQVKEQSKSETGWLYWRDAIILPAVMQGGVWLVKLVLDKSLAPTVKA